MVPQQQRRRGKRTTDWHIALQQQSLSNKALQRRVVRKHKHPRGPSGQEHGLRDCEQRYNARCRRVRRRWGKNDALVGVPLVHHLTCEVLDAEWMVLLEACAAF